MLETFLFAASVGGKFEPDYRTQCQFRENLKGCEQPHRRPDDEPMQLYATSTGPGYTFIDLSHVFSVSS